MGLGNIPKGAMRGFSIVAFCALIQYYLGMLNVVLSVPPKLAHLHQVNKLFNIIFSLWEQFCLPVALLP